MPILTEEERLGTLVAGRYRLESILGRGGTGVVFEAAHTWTGRRVAVKLLKPEYARDLGLVRRFLQEARTAAGIEHPNVVQVLDMGNEADGTVFLVLELLEGESLSRLLERRDRITPAEALTILVPLMDALVTAHDKGIIHRDLKPDNVFLRRDAQDRVTPKLLDFGMAKMVDAAWGHATQSGTLVGTPFYMSPEQAEGKPDQGPASDVWSMGVILYRCLTGGLPFFAETPTALLISIVQAQAPPVRNLAPEVPERFAHVIDRALIADRDERWADMSALLGALRAAAEAEDIPFPALPDPERFEAPEPFDPGPRQEATQPTGGRRATPWLFVAGAAIVVGGALAYAASQGDGAAAEQDVLQAPAAIGTATDPEPSPEETPAESTVAAPQTAEATDEPSGTGSSEQTADDAQARAEAAPAPRRPRSPRQEETAGASAEPDSPSTAMESSGMRIPGVTTEW